MHGLLRALPLLLIAGMLACCSDNNPSGDVGTGPLSKAPAASSMTITGITPSTAEIADVITITGGGFPGKRLASRDLVTINGVAVTVYTSWSSTVIKVVVPSGALNASGTVVVTSGNKTSNAYPFTIAPSTDVTIGTQVWSGANLNVTALTDGTPIPEITDQAAWVAATGPAWCWLNNDPIMGRHYGRLYNWAAVASGKLAPVGYHIPTDQEWKTLSMYLGMSQAEADQADGYFGTHGEGGKIKEMGTSLWLYPNVATNETGFTALPGDMRGRDGTFMAASGAVFWSSTGTVTSLGHNGGWARALDNGVSTIGRFACNPACGFSVRLIKDGN